jgi:hypothetical protein
MLSLLPGIRRDCHVAVPAWRCCAYSTAHHNQRHRRGAETTKGTAEYDLTPRRNERLSLLQFRVYENRLSFCFCSFSFSCSYNFFYLSLIVSSPYSNPFSNPLLPSPLILLLVCFLTFLLHRILFLAFQLFSYLFNSNVSVV